MQQMDNCWAEFSIDNDFQKVLIEVSKELLFDNLDVKLCSNYHVSLLYGYNVNESKKLIEIVKKHFVKPIVLIAKTVKRGDISPVILLDIEFSRELDDLFWDLYENVGSKKHSLIQGKFDPHITLATSNNKTLDKIDFDKIKNVVKGINFTISQVFSFDEDANGNNILLDTYTSI